VHTRLATAQSKACPCGCCCTAACTCPINRNIKFDQQHSCAGTAVLEAGCHGGDLGACPCGCCCAGAYRYPIGSNTKLFTAIAAWQLHRAGKLSVFDPASKYLTNHTDLGLDAPWCPRVYGAPDSSEYRHTYRGGGGDSYMYYIASSLHGMFADNKSGIAYPDRNQWPETVVHHNRESHQQPRLPPSCIN
jgi:hypothetical protein